ncbi:MAG: peptidylprolyl isomerase [Synechococcales bacterium]|nr:peptidylprolyl isomerase [Synechococcales bacterium]
MSQSLKPLVTTILVTAVWSVCLLLSGMSAAQALPQGNAITDPKALLRNSLPINNPTVRKLQATIEDISTQLRANRRWGAVQSDLSRAERLLNDKAADLLATVPDDRQPQAEALITDMKASVTTMLAGLEAKNKQTTSDQRSALLDQIGKLEILMAQGFPYEVPGDYANLPQLKGRATIQFKTSQGDLTAIVDGYSAPVTAGNFVDLVQRGFYNGLPFIRAEDFYVLQTGDPDGPEQGFIDPKTQQYRAVPLEILVKGDKEPTYGITLEDAGRYLDQPMLPFSAYGAMAMARPNDEPNGGSSQFFFFLFEPELTPAGLNLLDGRYAIFGYVTEGANILRSLKAGDKILSAQVVAGAENLVTPRT